jgi:hypothetical protein
MSGEMPNHAKKQRKKAIHDMWKARICGVLKLKKSILVALPSGLVSVVPFVFFTILRRFGKRVVLLDFSICQNHWPLFDA